MIASVYGNYRVERELGEGGMSHVYVGRTIAATETLPAGFAVVLKIMSDELAGDVTARKRFVKEAQILSRLRHRYITRFYEFINDERGAVLVMELVEGTPVDVVLTERGALPVADAISICQCLLEALVYAHGKGIVHRDIKPANLIQEPSGVVKVTDFGIGKIKEGAGAGQTVLTRSGFLLGTPHYMSPEQIREPQNAGPKSDVYSSAVLLYEMLTGTLPFNSRSLPKLIDAIYRGEKEPPRKVKFDIPRDVEAIVLKGMEPRAENRYESAREFFEALEEYNARQPLASHVVMPSDDPAHTVRQTKQNHWALVSVKGDGGDKHAISGDDVVGRDRACSIVLTHPAVSRRHARITLTGADAVIEDLKSANGTYVNNARVERVALKVGDIVRFGADPACSYVIKDH
ncbi:MAG: FHA domain-containing serine/threonine-protein kinase [Thermoanaerobaculia bacterium]